MISAWISFLFFIVKAIFIAGSLFVLWQALRKEVKKKTVILSMLVCGAMTGGALIMAENPSLLSSPYFAEETQSTNEDAPTTHFTGDAPGNIPLADGQGAFMQKMFILGSVVGAFFALAIGCFLFNSPQVSFQCSAIGICSALIGLTFL